MNPMNRASRRGLTKTEITVAIAGFLALNLAAALVYKFTRPKEEPKAVAAAVTTPTPSTPAAEDPEAKANAEKFRVYRAAGLSALEKGNWNDAVEQFTQALRVGKADSDIMELLKMAKEFQSKTPSAAPAAQPTAVAAAPAPEPEPEPVDPKKPGGAKKPAPKPAARPVASAAKPTDKTEKTDEAPVPAMLLITSIPTGLVIEVDGVRKDLTPAKVQVPAGSHSVTLWKGDNRLFQKMVSAEPGQVMIVDADVSAQLAPATPAVPEREKEPVAAAPAPERPRPEPVAAVAPAPTPAPTTGPAAGGTTAAPAVPSGKPTGELQIISLNVYGEVFVNGKSVGFPPVVAKNLPAESTKIEIKVDGAVRRSRTVDVVAGKRTMVKIP